MEKIIDAVDIKLIKKELTQDKFFRKTNKGDNEIYILTAHDSPNIMREIARLRELSFRTAGGGCGRSIDMDEYDTMKKPYKQLFVWDPSSEKILGGYRFIHGQDVVLNNGQPELSTAEMYHFSDKFIKEYLPYTIELGRSFVQPDYQSSKMGTKSLFALDNLWDGIGALSVVMPETKYLFGKVTIYPQYNAIARDLIFGFIDHFFRDKNQMVKPISPFQIKVTPQEIMQKFNLPNIKENYKLLNKEVRNLGENIPPLVNAYIGLSPEIYSFGYAIYHDFGNLIEFCIMIPLEKIYEEKKSRHIESYLKEIKNNS